MNLKKLLKLVCLLIGLSLVMAQTDHTNMDHSNMDHSNMNHNNMNHDTQTQTTNESDFSEREQAVMPFDLNSTLHIFKDTATGGIQQVVTNKSDDVANITLIQSHLAKEAEAFAKGVFNDPSYLHGENMPGLVDLQVAGTTGLLAVMYQNLENGGQITYSSEDLSVVIAVHLWFQAQVVDHGDHASN